MKVRQLIEELQAQDQDAEVHFSYPSGDYWKTKLAPAVRNIDEGFVKHSEYHDKDSLITDEEDEEKCYEADQARVVVLS